MSTNDVPGYRSENADELAMGAWAEHDDGSLMLVESTEGSRVIYSLFDMSRDPPIEYRDAMPEVSFKSTFSWDRSGKKRGTNEKWTWHDKTPFPWDRIIKRGGRDGSRLPSREHYRTEAERMGRSAQRFAEEGERTAAGRVADELRLRGEALDMRDLEHRMDRMANRIDDIWNRIKGAVSRLPKGKAKSGRSARS